MKFWGYNGKRNKVTVQQHKYRMKKDRVFARKKEKITPFEFNRAVADVFDDMLNRSVPMYGEAIRRQAQMTRQFYQNGSIVYDLGCSHGNLGFEILNEMKDRPLRMVGVDSSIPMIEKYAGRLKAAEYGGKIDLICGRLQDIRIVNASVVLINLTLQFLPPQMRDRLVREIWKGLLPGGVLLLTEKIIHPEAAVNHLQTSFYERFKLENGYSRLEISQKRDALDKVLIPDTLSVHESRLKSAGFSVMDVWLKWYNFASVIAIK